MSRAKGEKIFLFAALRAYKTALRGRKSGKISLGDFSRRDYALYPAFSLPLLPFSFPFHRIVRVRVSQSMQA